MVFGIIILLENMYGNVIAHLSLVNPKIILGLLMGGAIIYWFTGAATQAVTTGAYRAVVFIKKNINLDKAEASIEDSKEVVKICTQYAQKGMINIFIVIFFLLLLSLSSTRIFSSGISLRLPSSVFSKPSFLLTLGGAWDNAKKIVEVDLKEKGTGSS